VRDRIQWIKNKAGEATATDLEYLVTAARRVLVKAEALEQMTAAVGAIKELGILTGHRIEKREQTLKTNPDEMTDAELLIIAARGRPKPEEPMTEARIERAIEHALSVADEQMPEHAHAFDFNEPTAADGASATVDD
jgi:hypothetical protein